MTSKYSNGKIYKIVDNKSDMIYIGSTCKSLEERLKAHETDLKKFKKGQKNYITSFKILEKADYKIEIVKNYSCNSKHELEQEEGKFMVQMKSNGINVVNKCFVGRTINETKAFYRQNNKIKINDIGKNYYKTNKSIINEKQKTKHNCPCGGKFTNAGKSIHEKSVIHKKYAENCLTTNNSNNIYNITININNIDELKELEIDFLNALK